MVLGNMRLDFVSMIPYLSWFWQGTLITVGTSLITVVLGCLIGFVATIARRSRFKIFQVISNAYTQFVRGTPILLQLYIWTLGLPQIGIKVPDLFGPRSSLYITVVLALAINSGAYIAEIFRSGLNSVDKGQVEAARSLGLSSGLTMKHVILPQAIKNILPALGNEFIMMIKESSLVSTVGIGDIMYQQKIINGATYRVLEPLIIIGIIYFVLTSILTSSLGVLEKRLNQDVKNS